MNAGDFVGIAGIAGAAVGLDAVYLTLRQSFHDDFFHRLQKQPLRIRMLPAVLVYVLLITAVYLYAVRNASRMEEAALRGAVIGFIMYAFYDLTNYATLANYTLEMVIVDSLWGALLACAAAAPGFYIKGL